MRTAILPFGFWIASAGAFVTLDTSVPRSPAEFASADSGTVPDSISGLGRRNSPEKFGSVLFLSGDDQRVYAAIGMLKLLQDSGLAPDLIVAEGAAAIPAAAYALGYKMHWLDSLFHVHPLESYLGARSSAPVNLAVSPKQNESEGLPWRRNLVSGRVEQNDWNRDPDPTVQPGKLALSWLMARLLRGAPSESARIPIAFQLVEARTGIMRLERPGDWQGLVLAAATKPGNAAAALRGPQWIDGGVFSQGQPLPESWPIAVERLIVLEVPVSILAKPLRAENSTSLDLLRSRWKSVSESHTGVDLNPNLVVKILPSGDLESPSAWVEMGYQTGLHSLNQLRAAFHSPAPTPEKPSHSGQESLLWSNASFTARGAGYFQLLRQRIRAFARKGEPEIWIPELENEGFYSDIDVEWADRYGADGEAGLVLGAQEDPRLLLSAGASLRIMGQSLLRQVPEGMLSLSWAEPHYLPFKAEADWLAGGNHPGYGGQLFVEPPAPFWTRISVYNTRQSHRTESPYSDWRHAGAIPISIREDHSGFRLGMGPTREANLVAEIQRTVLDNLAVSPDPSISDDGFASTDFAVTLHLEMGDPAGLHLKRMDFTSSYVDPANELGLLRPGFALHHAAFEAGLGPWEIFGDGRYADRVDLEWNYPDWPDAYALWLMPSMQPLSFGSDVTVSRWRHFRYALAGGGWNYSWKRLSGRLVGGEATYMRLDGFLGAEKRGFFPFWEGGISLATDLGPLRLACGGFGDSGPFFSLQWGTRLDLNRLLSDSEL